MKTFRKILDVVANGRNPWLLLIFAILGFTLFLTPPFKDSFDYKYWPVVLAIGWNFMWSWLIVGFARLIGGKPQEDVQYFKRFTGWIDFTIKAGSYQFKLWKNWKPLFTVTFKKSRRFCITDAVLVATLSAVLGVLLNVEKWLN